MSPIPPTPMRPSTADARTLISNRYSQKERNSPLAWGQTPQRTSDHAPPPAARTASRGPPSTPSTDSYPHLPSVPTLETASARAPVSGVRPVTDRMMMAVMISGTARMAENRIRSGQRTAAGAKPRAATNARGTEITMPMTVPTQAISTEIHVCASASGSFDQSGAENISQR